MHRKTSNKRLPLFLNTGLEPAPAIFGDLGGITSSKTSQIRQTISDLYDDMLLLVGR